MAIAGRRAAGRDADPFEASRLFEVLMTDEVEPRRKSIEDHAKFVRNLDM